MLSSIRKLGSRLFRAEKIHAEISEELQFHIDSKIADLIRHGMSPDEAKKTALQKFGPLLRIGEQGFDVRGSSRLGDWLAELNWALRLLRKQPLKTAVLIATLAVGVGVNATSFGIIRSVLLQPLPFASPEQLLVLRQSNHGQLSGVSYPHFLDWRGRARSFSGMAVYLATSGTLTGVGEPVRLNGAIVSASIFDVLGIRPVRGKLFAATDDRRTGRGKIVISDRLWKTRFGQQGDILGRIVQLDGHSFEIAGIIPAASAFPLTSDPVEYWITVSADADPALYGGSIPTSRGYPRYEGALARLRPGVSLVQAAAEMKQAAEHIALQYPNSTSANEVAVVPVLDVVVGHLNRTMLLLLYGAVSCVLLVTVVNIATVLLADTLLRAREFALRLALGARAARVFRQVMVESLVLALIASLISLLPAWGLTKLFVILAPPTIPRLAKINFDFASALYVLLVSLSAGALIGCLPALAARKPDLNDVLKQGARNASRRVTGIQPGTVLLALQIALSMVLTCSAILLAASFYQILHSPRGFSSHNVLTATFHLPPRVYGQQNDRVRAFYNTVLAAVRAIPGVQSAALSDVLPLSGETNSTTIQLGETSEAGLPATDLRFVDPLYFSTLNIPLERGRFLTNRDGPASSPCVLVNRAFVRRYLAGRDPLNHSVRLGWGGNAPKQIVGVVGDIRPDAASPSVAPEVYVPFAQFSLNEMSLLIRTAASPDQMSPALRKIVGRIDPLVPVDRIRTLDEFLLLSTAPQQFLMWLLIGFAAVTVLLVAVGIYGVLSNATAARTQEFGIRLALGGSRRHIGMLVLSHAMGITVVGLGVGALLSRYSSHLLTSLVFDAHAGHPITVLVFSACILLATVLAACAMPGKRAATIDPAAALRAS